MSGHWEANCPYCGTLVVFWGANLCLDPWTKCTGCDELVMAGVDVDTEWVVAVGDNIMSVTYYVELTAPGQAPVTLSLRDYAALPLSVVTASRVRLVGRAEAIRARCVRRGMCS